MDAGHVRSRRGPSVAGEDDDQARILAEAAFVGLPIDRFIRSSDPDELQLLERVRVEGAKVLDTALDNLARKIVKEYSAAKERGSKRKK